jgi:hypothetical protein
MSPYLGTDNGSPESLYNLDGWGLSPAAGTFAPTRFCALLIDWFGGNVDPLATQAGATLKGASARI